MSESRVYRVAYEEPQVKTASYIFLLFIVIVVLGIAGIIAVAGNNPNPSKPALYLTGTMVVGGGIGVFVTSAIHSFLAGTAWFNIVEGIRKKKGMTPVETVAEQLQVDAKRGIVLEDIDHIRGRNLYVSGAENTKWLNIAGSGLVVLAVLLVISAFVFERVSPLLLAVLCLGSYGVIKLMVVWRSYLHRATYDKVMNPGISIGVEGVKANYL